MASCDLGALATLQRRRSISLLLRGAAAADSWLLCAAALGMGALHIINSG